MTWPIILIVHGNDRFMAFPVFMSRRFFHMDILVRRDAGIEKPEDLKGKHVGIKNLQGPPRVWNRGMLQHEYNVHPRDMIFWRDREADHGLAPRFTPPPDVKVNEIPPGKSILSMLKSGELQVALQSRSEVGYRPGVDDSYIRQLFPNVYAECIHYYKKTGLYPINHGSVIKREIVEKHPWAVLNLYKAFEQAAELADKRRMAHVGYHLETGLLPPEAEKALQTPLARPGIRFNKKVLDTYLQYCYEQGLTPRLMKLEELYPASMMET